MEKIEQTSQVVPTIGLYQTFGLFALSLIIGITFVVGFLKLIKKEEK